MIIKRFSLVNTLFHMLTWVDISDIMIEYFDSQSKKGFQIIRFGFVFSEFEQDSSVRYLHKVIPFEKHNYSFYNTSSEWEFCFGYHALAVYRRVVNGLTEETEFFSEAEYAEEQQWLDQISQNGRRLVNCKGRIYQFVPADEEVKSIRHFIDYRPDVENFESYINTYSLKKWQFVCMDADKYYFLSGEVPVKLKPAVKHAKPAEVSKAKANAHIIALIACVVIFTVLAIGFRAVLHTPPAPGEDDARGILLPACGFWMVVTLIVAIKSYFDLRKVQKGVPKKAAKTFMPDDIEFDRQDRIRNLKKAVKINFFAIGLAIIFEIIFIFNLIAWFIPSMPVSILLKIVSIPLAILVPFSIPDIIEEIGKTNAKIEELRDEEQKEQP